MLSFLLEKIKYLEKKMRKILSLALLISLGMGNIGTVIAAEKTPVLNAGAEEVKVDGTKPETKKKKETKIKPTKINMII